MSSTVWALPEYGLFPAARVRDTYILRFLKDAKCSVRVAEVRLFKTCFTMPSRCLFLKMDQTCWPTIRQRVILLPTHLLIQNL
jgi:hypothetical protein